MRSASERLRWSNWSGTVQCEPERILRPDTEDRVSELVQAAARLGKTVRIIGAGHSFTPLGETAEWMVQLDRIQGIRELNEAEGTATVYAGTRLKDLGDLLFANGWAQENLGDINRQTIGGAIGTGTHGTGAGYGSLATQAVRFRTVLGDGSVVNVDAGRPDWFKAMQVSLGAFGIITEVTLRIVPAKRKRLISFRTTLEETLARLDEWRVQHEHFEFFWFPHTAGTQVKTMNTTAVEARPNRRWNEWSKYVVENGLFWGMSEACRLMPSLSRHVSRASARFVPVFDEVGYGHRLFVTPRHVKFNEMEYSVPAEAMRGALLDIQRAVQKRRFAVHFPVECRYVRGDDIWLSPAYGRDSAYIAVHMYKGMPFQAYFEEMERILLHHGGRPHWGKWHSLAAEQLRPLYPKWGHAMAIREQCDPAGILMNGYVRRLLGE
ncbi:D-arabinono-1,4-lactone oxidase [Paenibacillus apiarius]|uniref:D-arabinono-1,4-lactone oxidase n=1 Tax=Paenibacillus apiarius TaxID=46240 RepID=UPI00197D50BA|nr:D-arabinono-1,4-lactone oxidase [Paenibacillus apiarius]MBN3525757.1 FAD-binding protein [Paenibacillus apiarius]